VSETTSLKLPTKLKYPALPLRDIVVFPYMIVPLFVGREKSIFALEEALEKDQKVLLLTQKDAGEDDPQETDLYQVGCAANIVQLLKLPDGTVKALVEGQKRVRVQSFESNENYLEACVEPLEDVDSENPEISALLRAARKQFEQYSKLSGKIAPEVIANIDRIETPSKFSDTVAAHIGLRIPEKQNILEEADIYKRLESLSAYIESEIGVMLTEKRIRKRVKRQMEKSQKEYYLTEQMKAIQKELGETDDTRNEIQDLEKRIKKTKFSKEAREKATAELKKLKTMSPMSAEATVVRNYLDWILDIPWGEPSKTSHDLRKAKAILDEDHYGLEKVKERILEYLAVQQRVEKMKGPILCLVGPPGVGKTSLGKSIARATERSFVRISLGGVRDESEIRGHRRTYIGSMPGKIIQGMKKAKSTNPLMILDEIDKLASDWRGDPAAAMLEVLDPEQNFSFSDHYLEVDYDLSNVMFITTANSLNLPGPLLDRMEIIRISGYTEDEKVEIAKKYLIPKSMKAHGMQEKEWQISDEGLKFLIRRYTREAGVRSLEREIANLIRKATKRILLDKLKKVQVTVKNIEKFAGIPRFKYSEIEDEDRVGVTTGLAWTEVGGEILMIEALMTPGKGKMTITGKLGDVMQESVQAATSYVRARCIDFGITPPTFEKRDIHVHVPEGATPKDGPSAGVAMVTSIVSVLTGVPIRRDVAMTGEITLRGRVLPIGGLKEKLLAAHRARIRKVLIPEENQKDLQDIPNNIKANLDIVPVANLDQVLHHALTNMPDPIVWKEDLDLCRPVEEKNPSNQMITH